MRVLKYGRTGDDVKYLQYLLNTFTPDLQPIEIDGSFGRNTEARVKVFQQREGIDVDGSVGKITRGRLGLDEIMVFAFEPRKDEMWVAGTPYGSKSYPLKTLKQWAKDEKAEIVFNLALFNLSGKGEDRYGAIKGRTLTYCRGKGKDIGYGGTEEKIVINDKNVFSGAKVAIKNGTIKSVSYIGKRARNATGILKDGRIIVIQTLVRKTEYEIAKYAINNYDVELLLIQDGGGSVGVYFAGDDTLIACEKEGKDGRPVATALCVTRHKQTGRKKKKEDGR